jgi:hypothetical protein
MASAMPPFDLSNRSELQLSSEAHPRIAAVPARHHEIAHSGIVKNIENTMQCGIFPCDTSALEL